VNQFPQLNSSKKLENLAKTPIELKDPDCLTLERLDQYQVQTGPLKLLYAFERIDESVLLALKELAEETKALEKMQMMQNGDIMNQIMGFDSEKRQVLHTAMRDFFSHKNEHLAAKKASEAAFLELKKLETFEKKIENEKKFDTFVQIGIGGSDLGPRAIYLALQAYQKKSKKVFFVSNVDPDDAAFVLKQIDLQKTLFIVVSKSGTTLETLTNEKFFRERYEKIGLNPKDHFVAVTGEGSPMDNPKEYLESFYIWDFVGGRYSVTSMVGGVVLACGLSFDIYQEFLRGASMMDKAALEPEVEKNMPLLAALIGIWNHNFLNHPTLAVIPYSQALSRFPAHLQQLDMESNGKQITKEGKFCEFETGPVIWGEPGTNGQHSFYQLIHQGTQIVPVCFIGFKHSQRAVDWEFESTNSQQKLNANLLAQMMALAQGQNQSNPNKVFKGNRPSHLLYAKELTPQVLGALLAFFEHKVAFQGFIWQINSFDQEGVQLGKVLAKEFLRIMQDDNEDSITDFPLGRKLLKVFLES
jgi:glucose-6-phosphate isomerase